MICKLIMTRKQIAAVAALAAAGGLTIGAVMVSATPALAKAGGCAAIRKLTSGSGETLDLAEARLLASQAFTRMDHDRNGKLRQKELGGRLSASDFKSVNTDGDDTLEETEYLALVEQRFTAANPDKDGTIDCREFTSHAGKALKKLLK